MGFSYRKRKGPVTFSASSRGMRMSTSAGCIVPVILLALSLLAVPSEARDTTVYITKTGTKYHAASCHHLKKSKIAISLKEAKKRGYRACSVCVPPASAYVPQNGDYCPVPRTADGRIMRDRSAVRRFMKMTGYPRGRPGYVVDHIVPLYKGGADDPSNMQWQSIEEAKAKDAVE